MIVQCEACQTRFRLADDKVKDGGTKVRCSKCKQVFTVMPAEQEPEVDTVDFDSLNMEKVDDEAAGDAAIRPDDGSPQPESATGELDFSALEQDLEGAVSKDELADDFTFAGSGPSSADSEADFDAAAAFEETPGPSGPSEFSFEDDASAASIKTDGDDFSVGDSDAFESDALSFDEEKDAADTFAFGDPDDGDSFSFGDDATEKPSGEPGASDEFSLDDENPFGEEAAAEWSDQSASDDVSFDFDEPSFESSPPAAPKQGSDELQFGEINFADNDDATASNTFAADDDFSKATLQPSMDSRADLAEPPRKETPARDLDDREPLAAPVKKSKSSLSSLVTLLVLLLVALGGGAGYLYLQEGALNLNVLTRYLPFLQEYIGEVPTADPGHQIGINIAGSSYVKGKAGQLLVIQGAAVNNYPTTRSAITIKGVLLDANNQTLLQQTVFCGNYLSEDALSTMPFTAIEEAMNNQFGDSLSNMNVASGASIPFTIVFRNLPAGIANINVEIVDSKPGVR